MDRLNFDVYKRQAKPNRIKEMISEQKVKIKEQSRVKTFNRLIQDANRRLLEGEKNLNTIAETNENTLTNSSNQKKFSK